MSTSWCRQEIIIKIHLPGCLNFHTPHLWWWLRLKKWTCARREWSNQWEEFESPARTGAQESGRLVWTKSVRATGSARAGFRLKSRCDSSLNIARCWWRRLGCGRPRDAAIRGAPAADSQRSVGAKWAASAEPSGARRAACGAARPSEAAGRGIDGLSSGHDVHRGALEEALERRPPQATAAGAALAAAARQQQPREQNQDHQLPRGQCPPPDPLRCYPHKTNIPEYSQQILLFVSV